MKIDPKLPANGGLQSDRVTTTPGSGVPPQAKPVGATQAQSEDTFRVSSRHTDVQRLAAHAATAPDVRAEKVAPLQAKVQRGGYKPDSQKVADALITEHNRSSAKG